MTRKKKVFIIVGSIALVIVFALSITNFVSKKRKENYTESHYIFDKSFRNNKKTSAFSSNKYLSNGAVTSESLAYFRFLEKEFAVNSIKELSIHLDKVKKYLSSKYNESEAHQLFEIYQKYLRCQITLVNDPRYNAKTAGPRHILILLNDAQNFRREKLGREMADILFGPEVKEREYLIRRSTIINDSSLYGRQKEMRLQKLKNDMWGREQVLIGEENIPYQRYQLKLLLYQKDLHELNENARKLKLDEFRKEFFSTEQIRRLDEAEKRIAQEKNNEARYRAAERKILELTDVTQEEKDGRIKLLREKFFGKEAEAFRRREAIRKGAGL